MDEAIYWGSVVELFRWHGSPYQEISIKWSCVEWRAWSWAWWGLSPKPKRAVSPPISPPWWKIYLPSHPIFWFVQLNLLLTRCIWLHCLSLLRHAWEFASIDCRQRLWEQRWVRFGSFPEAERIATGLGLHSWPSSIASGSYMTGMCKRFVSHPVDSSYNCLSSQTQSTSSSTDQCKVNHLFRQIAATERPQ